MNLGDFDSCNNHNQFFLYDRDELVATVELRQENGVKWICNVYVSPSYRRRGIATDLLRFAMLIGGEKLTVRKDNYPAIGLYQKLGFRTFDSDNEYYYMQMIREEDPNGPI